VASGEHAAILSGMTLRRSDVADVAIKASLLGAYNRIVRLNGPFGAGNQSASLSAPGLAFWKY